MEAVPSFFETPSPSRYKGVWSWLLTMDHKRIGIMYLFSILFWFLLAVLLGGMIRLELMFIGQTFMSAEVYNSVFTLHGVIMIFLFIIPALPAIFGNFFLPIQIGTDDVFFPKLNLLSWYLYMAGGLIAIEFNMKGPNYSVVSACASAAHSIGDALRLVQRGDADVMISGGAEATVCEIGIAGFCALRALSTRNDAPDKASRPFDKDRDGFVMGDGAALVVIEELERAKKRGAKIYAELSGFGMSCDAFHMTAPADDGEGAGRAMKNAIKDAGMTAEDIDYINAHGTSTPLNDKIETRAIKGALGEHARKVMISSSKSMTGHLLGAAGGIETAICALALRDQIAPPTINYTTPDPDCDLDYVPNTARQVKIRACLNNSLGFGGHNACLLLKKFE